MAECNKQAVEEVKRNIESRKEFLQNEINNMRETISRLSKCNGTKENPHNHNSEIASLRSQISANEALIAQLSSLLNAVEEATKTMEEADRELRSLVEAYLQEKTVRMKLTSAMLYDEMKILEEEYKAGMINSYEYEGTLVHLKEQYIETLQSEIDVDKERIKSVSGNPPEYDKIMKMIRSKREELISFVESNGMTYPKSLAEELADEQREIISNLQRNLSTAEGCGISAIQNKLGEAKSRLEALEKDIMSDMVYVWEISKETEHKKVCSQIYERLAPLAVNYGTPKIVNDCIDYRLKEIEGETREEKLEGYLHEQNLKTADCYLSDTGISDFEKRKINLHWMTEADLFNKPMPEWWLDRIEIPQKFVVNESNYEKLSEEPAFSEFYSETYMIADLVASSVGELYALDVDKATEDIMFEAWFDLNYGHLDPESTDKRRQKYLLEKLDLGVHRENLGIYTVYGNENISPEFENATLLYLNMYEHYDEYYTGFSSLVFEEGGMVPYIGTRKMIEYLSGSINSDKQITNWLNADIKNKRMIPYAEKSLVEGIISGKYLQVDQTVLNLNDKNAEPWIDENGNAYINNWVYDEKYPNGCERLTYEFNVGITDFANQKYVQADEFMLELNNYINYKVENNIYTQQLGVEDGFKVDELERQFYEECPQEYNEMFDALQVKAEELRQQGIPDEENTALVEIERQVNYLRNCLLGIEERKSLYEFSRVRDVDVAVEIGKGIIDAAALAAGIVMTGPAGVFVGLGIDSLAIALCVEHGDDEEAVARTVGVIAGMGASAVTKYADEVTGLTYANKLDIDSDFKGFNLDDSEIFFKNADEVAEGGTDVWEMTEGGGIINGREYSQHAMERMAPDTPAVRAELSRRAETLAKSKGLQVGTPEYYQFCQKYVDPRNIPPVVIEDAIRNTTAVPGHTLGTFMHQTTDVTVIVNEAGNVITVIPK